MAALYLIVEENPNCAADERMFSTSGGEKEVLQVRLDRPDGTTGWCEIVGVEAHDKYSKPTARQVEDSAAGVAWLVTGGHWGLRLRAVGARDRWAMDDETQWGVPFLVLDDGPDVVKFK